jgi:hypothetical protein
MAPSFWADPPRRDQRVDVARRRLIICLTDGFESFFK